jgi:BirA family biotin operon repressor/biotin-[acetyl-CoA-carboxylase] ligase
LSVNNINNNPNKNNIIGEPFIELKKVASTNSYAIEQAQANLAQHGFAFFAYEQTAGKGQRGKEWLTTPMNNIILSIVLDTTFLSINNQFALSVCIALACKDFLNRYIEEEEINIKWPNDIYLRDRKAAGILIENIIRGQDWPFAIVGIGMNINQTNFPLNLRNPVSLTQISGIKYNTIQLAKELCANIETRYQQLKLDKGIEQLVEYNQHLYKLNEKVTLKKESILFECFIDGVNASGELKVEKCMYETFKFGEIEWVI